MKTTYTKNDEIKSLVSMIDSCFAYGGCAKDSYNYKRYILPYRARLSEKTFNKAYEKRVKELQSCTIEHSTYTDGEGGSYNSIIWPNN